MKTGTYEVAHEKILSVKEAAVVLGVARDSVVRLIRRGKLAAYRFPSMGRKGINITWRIPDGGIERFLKENRGGR